jgi:hypothetical protein
MMKISNPTTETSLSPMKCIANIIENHFSSKITKLTLDTQDEFRGGISLGACMEMTTVDSNDMILSSNTIITDCHRDEVVALSLALDMPIFITESLVDSLCEDATLVSEDNKLCIVAPLRSKSKSIKPSTTKSQSVMKDVPLAWEIYDPSKFFRLSTLDKREILRVSGVNKLPKPRQGEIELDRMLLDLMDDAVRGEIFRIQSKLPVQSADEDSVTSRQVTLSLMGQALEAGDYEKAEKLREKFAMMTVLRADPTQEVGSYDRFLDQDDWYMQARRKAMSSKKTNDGKI